MPCARFGALIGGELLAYGLTIGTAEPGGSGTVDSALNATSTNPVQNKVVSAAINSAAENSTKALELAESQSGTISTLQSKVQQLSELVVGNSGITANPYSISFDNLDGIIVNHGIYNETKQRVEC